ncbi:uncharacterized protein LOC133871509 [Alnus glutinosa]|uniref:uncharacterized protein LOC133871509 n=1 Tax=Alnus glutinosa TaxID=3517 RepID=UPI002D777238|nr:uncharacterized protein LOC133871509 [Alnus glutinosa]
MKFKGQARVWWHSVKEYLHRLRFPPISDWEEMKLKLQEKYLPMDYEDSIFVDLLAHKQGTTTVDEYTHRFHELSICSRLTETERQSLTRYKAGRQEDISRELINVRVTSLDKVYQLALRLEQQAKLMSARGRGHYAFMCPTREQRHSLYCEENPPEEEAEQHSPVATPANDVETPEETLESRMNVISLEAVQKLKLPMEKHPKPYRVSWVDDTTIPVKQRCLGKKLVLKPMNVQEFEQPTAESQIVEVRVLTLCKFTVACKECGLYIALGAYPSASIQARYVLPTEIEDMLKEFQDVMPGEFPRNLPPMRNIQHAIDLFPRASLPNLPSSLVDHVDHLRQLLQTLRFESFFVNLKKGTFAQDNVIFLGFIVLSKGLTTDPKKVRTIMDWPNPNNLRDDPPSLNAPRKAPSSGPLLPNKPSRPSRNSLRRHLCLWLPNFEAPFEESCDASHSGIGGVLSQGGHPIAYFSEKLNEAFKRYSTYDLELYALVITIKHWCHYLIHQEFLLFTDHDSLRHLNVQKKLNARHARWVNYLQQFTFVLWHKAGMENTVADALSLKESYPHDPDFGTCYKALLTSPNWLDGHYSLLDGYLFKGTQLCLPHTSIRDFVIQELHAGGLVGHFGRGKIIALVEDRFYWPHLK